MRAVLTLILIFIGVSPFFATAAAPGAGQQLQALIARAWRQHLANNPLEASLEGYHRYDGLWPDPSLARQRREAREAGENLAALKRIEPADLTPAEQLDYRLFEYRLRDEIAGYTQKDGALLLINQLWGPQLLGTTAKQLRFETPADYHNWIKRLRTIGHYLDAFTRRLQRGLRRGVSQPRSIMQRVPAEIAGEISPDPEKSPFYAPFRRMPETISAARQSWLRAQAKAAIVQEVNPAYKRFARFINKVYIPRARTSVGVAALPGGRAYYRYLVQHFTTTTMTPAQIHGLGLREVARIRAKMEQLFHHIGFKGSYREFLRYLRTDPKFYYARPATLLEAYRAAAKKVDPYLVKIVGTWMLPRVPYGVRPIPAALAPNTYPAYSVPPAGDGSVAGYVGVNLYRPRTRPKYDIQVLMCHEGRPGHQLQIPLAMALRHLPPFRRFAYYNVYGEGWALYAETLCNELGLYDNPYSRFGYLNYQMWRAVRLVVDTGIHSGGWSRERAIRYMEENTALSDQNITNEVNRYIAWPGQALSYLIGELHILKLRDEAKRELGTKYSLRDFDDVVLGEGSLPMPVLTDVVNRWIAHTLAGRPAEQLPYARRPRSLN